MTTQPRLDWTLRELDRRRWWVARIGDYGLVVRPEYDYEPDRGRWCWETSIDGSPGRRGHSPTEDGAKLYAEREIARRIEPLRAMLSPAPPAQLDLFGVVR